MARRIDNPILNSPFDAPARHFRFDDEGITSEVVEGRRPSSYFVPIPATRKKASGGLRYRVDCRPCRANTGKIAVKVINHYGDEVMKVYEVV